MKAKADYEAKLEFFETLTPETVEDLKGSDLELYNHLQLQRRREKLKHKKEEQQRILDEKLLKEEQLKKAKQQTKKQQHKKGTPELSRKHRASMMRTAMPRSESTVLVESDKPRISPLHDADDSKKKGLRHKTSDTPKHGDAESRLSRHRYSARTGSITSEDAVAEISLSVQFGTFFTDFNEMLPILEKWDRKKGSVLTVGTEKQVSQPAHLKGKGGRRSKRNIDISARSRVTLVGPEITYPPRRSTESIVVLPALEPVPSIIGITTWIMNYSDLDNTKEEIIISMLKESTDLKDTIAGLEEEPLKPKEDFMYNSIAYPEVRKKVSVSDVFTLISSEPDHENIETIDSPEDTAEMIEKTANSLKRLNRRHESKPKKIIEPAAESKKDEKSLAKIQEGFKLKPRWVLAPGDKVYSKIQFQPTQVGEYIHICDVEIMDTNLCHQIISKGLCDIPRLDMDPTILYPSVCDTKDQAQHLYRLTYFKDTMTFEFGPTICAKSKDKSGCNLCFYLTVT
ncbi:uncharacterized protein [Anabrus simplex]|uniref:uncharacterized protein n=1 Tax=Anabrus simplex TaxID=316456 RepID=UPI0035A2E2E4